MQLIPLATGISFIGLEQLNRLDEGASCTTDTALERNTTQRTTPHGTARGAARRRKPATCGAVVIKHVEEAGSDHTDRSGMLRRKRRNVPQKSRRG